MNVEMEAGVTRCLFTDVLVLATPPVGCVDVDVGNPKLNVLVLSFFLERLLTQEQVLAMTLCEGNISEP